MPEVALRLLSGRQATHYHEQGYFLLENAFTPAEMQAVIDAIAPLRERA